MGKFSKEFPCQEAGCNSHLSTKKSLYAQTKRHMDAKNGVKKPKKPSNQLDTLQTTLDKWSVLAIRTEDHALAEAERAKVAEKRLDRAEDDRHTVLDTNARLVSVVESLVLALNQASKMTASITNV